MCVEFFLHAHVATPTSNKTMWLYPHTHLPVRVSSHPHFKIFQRQPYEKIAKYTYF